MTSTSHPWRPQCPTPHGFTPSHLKLVRQCACQGVAAEVQGHHGVASRPHLTCKLRQAAHKPEGTQHTDAYIVGVGCGEGLLLQVCQCTFCWLGCSFAGSFGASVTNLLSHRSGCACLDCCSQGSVCVMLWCCVMVMSLCPHAQTCSVFCVPQPRGATISPMGMTVTMITTNT